MKNKTSIKLISLLIIAIICILHSIIKAESDCKEYPSTNGTCKSGDCSNGESKMKWKDGSVYKGLFKNNKMHGKGTFSFANGNEYVGQMINDNIEGEGTMTYSNKDQYIGQWKNCKRNGKGTFTTTDKKENTTSTYVCQWKDDKKDGHGTYSKKHNKLNISETYIGQYKDDNKHGQGTFTWDNGDKYVGQYKDNKRNGQGTFTGAKGDKYTGQWINSKFHGQGTYTNPKGEKYIGLWEEGSIKKGTYINADGDKFIGMFNEDNMEPDNDKGKWYYSKDTKQRLASEKETSPSTISNNSPEISCMEECLKNYPTAYCNGRYNNGMQNLDSYYTCMKNLKNQPQNTQWNRCGVYYRQYNIDLKNVCPSWHNNNKAETGVSDFTIQTN